LENNELLPFERNRYFSGKMLTSADFLAEQTYNNNKRRFMNQMLYGSGILCGLGVFSLDDQSLLIESGAAIDGLGREIVLKESVVKKLSTIPGFESLTTNTATLCLKYKEENVHAVYTINRQEGNSEYEFNRIEEGYELFIVDKDAIIPALDLESEFFVASNLVEHNGLTVDVKMPATVSAGKYVKIAFVIENHTGTIQNIDYTAVLQMPGFEVMEGGHELFVSFSNVTVESDKKVEMEYWVKAQQEIVDETSVVLKVGTALALVNGVAIESANAMNLQVKISDCIPRELALWETGKVSLEIKTMSDSNEAIVLGDIKLVRTDSAYIIEEIEERSVKKYLPTLGNEKKFEEYKGYFKTEAVGRTDHGESLPENYATTAIQDIQKMPRFESGTIEIPLNGGARKGEIYYSGEIMHGLGKGNVYVDIGFEKLEEDIYNGNSMKSTVYGNPDLFTNSKDEQVCVDTAVKVLNDKGSFVIAAKFLRDVDYLMLTFRWVAIKFNGGEEVENIEDYKNKSISAETPTVVLGTKESYFFNVKFRNMDKCAIAYELTEPGSGEITPDGIYTAPSKEGVYEIRIYCINMPMVCTYAYAIVKKKDSDSEVI